MLYGEHEDSPQPPFRIIESITLIVDDNYLQVESGLFQENDVKIVGKSIRDRVALIQWKRARRAKGVPACNGDAQGDQDQVQGVHEVQEPEPPMGQHAPPLQAPALTSQSCQQTQFGPEDPGSDRSAPIVNLPGSATSDKCETLLPRVLLTRTYASCTQPHTDTHKHALT